eukprot:6207738-Pleurochrysis_carterae.AAC.1
MRTSRVNARLTVASLMRAPDACVMRAQVYARWMCAKCAGAKCPRLAKFENGACVLRARMRDESLSNAWTRAVRACDADGGHLRSQLFRGGDLVADADDSERELLEAHTCWQVLRAE